MNKLFFLMTVLALLIGVTFALCGDDDNNGADDADDDSKYGGEEYDDECPLGLSAIYDGCKWSLGVEFEMAVIFCQSGEEVAVCAASCGLEFGNSCDALNECFASECLMDDEDDNSEYGDECALGLQIAYGYVVSIIGEPNGELTLEEAINKCQNGELTPLCFAACGLDSNGYEEFKDCIHQNCAPVHYGQAKPTRPYGAPTDEDINAAKKRFDECYIPPEVWQPVYGFNICVKEHGDSCSELRQCIINHLQ